MYKDTVNGKVERSHRNDQRYFYGWEKFTSVEDLNEKLKKHLYWSNRKPMRTLGNKSPIELLREKLTRPNGPGIGCFSVMSSPALQKTTFYDPIFFFSPIWVISIYTADKWLRILGAGN